MSTFRSTLIPDAPFVPSARTPFDDVARQEADARTIACQLFLSECLIAGTVAAYVRLDSTSVAVVKGDVLVRTAASSALTVTRADSSPLAAAGIPYGIAIRAAAPGSNVLVALDGVVGPDITGLAASSPGPVRVAAHRAAQTTALAVGDSPLGYVDATGWLTLARGLTVGWPAQGTAGNPGGDGSPVIVAGGAAGDAAHKNGAVQIDLGEAASTDGLTAQIEVLGGSAGTVLTVEYDDSSISGTEAIVLGVPSGLIRYVGDLQITGNLSSTQTTLGEQTVTTPGAAYTVLPALGNIVTIGPLVAGVTLNIAPGTPGVPLELYIKQDATGGRTVLWHASVIFASGISNTTSVVPNGLAWFQVRFFGGVAYVVASALLA